MSIPKMQYSKLFRKKGNPEDSGERNDGMVTVNLNDKPEENMALKERIGEKKFIILGLIAVVAVLILVIVIACVKSAGPSEPRGPFVTASTTCGLVQGERKDDVIHFYNISYAAAPVGARRFSRAYPLASPTCWNGTRNATRRGPPCLQFLENGTIVGQEDCLTLDVVTPDVASNSPLPVVVIIEATSLSGGFMPLEPTAPYNRTKGVVFVKPNFRLGTFGFLALDILSKESKPPTSGNYGLSDLIVALEWIQQNINNFGGDPNLVTLLGHGAGATLVAALTKVKQANNFYSKVWLSSPSVIAPGLLEPTMNQNELFIRTLGCSDVNCLRVKSFVEIVSATPDNWLMKSATNFLPQDPSTDDDNNHSWLVIDGNLLITEVTGKEKDTPKPTVFSTTQHSGHSKELQMRNSNWTEEVVERLVQESQIGHLNLTAAVFQHFNKSYSGLAELVGAVRTLCPLVSLARLRLDAPLYVARGGAGLAQPGDDVRAILGSPAAAEPDAALQQRFYEFVSRGAAPAAKPPLALLPREQAACDLLQRHSLVPRYAF